MWRNYRTNLKQIISGNFLSCSCRNDCFVCCGWARMRILHLNLFWWKCGKKRQPPRENLSDQNVHQPIVVLNPFVGFYYSKQQGKRDGLKVHNCRSSRSITRKSKHTWSVSFVKVLRRRVRSWRWRWLCQKEEREEIRQWGVKTQTLPLFIHSFIHCATSIKIKISSAFLLIFRTTKDS